MHDRTNTYLATGPRHQSLSHMSIDIFVCSRSKHVPRLSRTCCRLAVIRLGALRYEHSIYIYIYIYMYAYIYIDMYMCIYIYIYIERDSFLPSPVLLSAVLCDNALTPLCGMNSVMIIIIISLLLLLLLQQLLPLIIIILLLLLLLLLLSS